MENGVEQLVHWVKQRAASTVRASLKRDLRDMFEQHTSSTTAVALLRENMRLHGWTEQDVLVLVWDTLLSMLDATKRPELVLENALRHVKVGLCFDALFFDFMRSAVS